MGSYTCGPMPIVSFIPYTHRKKYTYGSHQAATHYITIVEHPRVGKRKENPLEFPDIMHVWLTIH